MRGCLTCRHVVFSKTGDAGYYGFADAVAEIKKTSSHIKCDCSLNPVWIEVTTDHYCGRWEGRLSVMANAGHVEVVLYGDAHTDLLERRNAELREQLKKARKLSATRRDKLNRLKELS